MTNKTKEIKKQPGKTNWNKIINQTDSEILRNVKEDPDSALLNNKKYYKPEKNGEK